MHLCISEFLPDNDEDDLIKFELVADGSFNEQIVQFLGHPSLNAIAEGEWLLTSEQVEQLSSIIGQSLPRNLKMYIGLEG